MTKLIGSMIVVCGLAATVHAVPKGTIGAYLWNGDPKALAPLSPEFSYNVESGKTNTIKRTAIGRYEIKLGGLATSAGHVQVNAYGPGSVFCKAGRWIKSGSDELVEVQCSKGETPTDSQFSLLFIM